MECVLKLQSTFNKVGFWTMDGFYTVLKESCNPALETILNYILSEHLYICTYRRIISSEQHLKRDIIPLLIHTKDDKSIELLIMILTNLTIPMECLFSIDIISRTDSGKHTIFDIENLLITIKFAFTDRRVTKVVIEFLIKNFNIEQSAKLSPEQCTNINYCLILLRNVLQVPEQADLAIANHRRPERSLKNQIISNIFSQGIGKELITLMNFPEASKWSVSMVQLIGVLYKDGLSEPLRWQMSQGNNQDLLADSSEDNGSTSSNLTLGSTSDPSEKGEAGSSNGGNGAPTPTRPRVPPCSPAGEPAASAYYAAYPAPPAFLYAARPGTRRFRPFYHRIRKSTTKDTPCLPLKVPPTRTRLPLSYRLQGRD